ncbi:Arc family DNA-binding protein [Methylobacterium sp. Leaf111]|uniref:Arc family DNA-binding protein n=1 Tax=Methylobacterium sp. Leaf111 TaxID=1736257 RepID=UPI0009EBF7D9|nr:Arc family DNA-binding protein [Methylobacterium sp. Leaf111]
MSRQSPQGQGKNSSIGFRTTPEMRERLDKAAGANGRSLAQEIENRLEQSFVGAPNIFAEAEAAYLSENRHAAELISAVGCALKTVDALSKRRGFSEIEHREALQAAFDVVKYAYLWTGEDAPDDGTSEIPAGTRRADYPPRPLGHAAAADRINYNTAWHDELIPGDTFEGRILDHWSGSGSVIVTGPSHSEVEADRSATLKVAQAALERGEVEFVSSDQRSQTPLKDIFDGR